MKKLYCAVILFFLFISSLSFSSNIERNENVRFGFAGTDWKKFGTVDNDTAYICKLILVSGIVDGLMFGFSPDYEKYFFDTSSDFYINALDQFYADYRNENVLVVYAMRVISMEIKGENKEDIEEFLGKVRGLGADLKKKKKEE